MSSVKIKGKSVPLLDPDWIYQEIEATTALKHSSKDEILITGHDDGHIIILNSISGSLIKKFKPHTSACLGISFNKEGNSFVTFSEEGSFTIFEKQTNTQEFIQGKTVKISDKWIEHIIWPNNFELIISSGKEILHYHIALDSFLKIAEMQSTITSLSMMDNDFFLASAYGGISIFSLNTKKIIDRIDFTGSLLKTVQSPDKKFLVTSSQDKSIAIWRMKNKKMMSMTGFEFKTTLLAFHHNSHLMANAYGDSVSAWDFSGKGPSGKQPVDLIQLNGTITDLLFSNRKNLLLSCTDQGLTAFWNPLKSNIPIAISEVIKQRINVASWSLDDSSIYIGLRNGAIISIKTPPQ